MPSQKASEIFAEIENLRGSNTSHYRASLREAGLMSFDDFANPYGEDDGIVDHDVASFSRESYADVKARVIARTEQIEQMRARIALHQADVLVDVAVNEFAKSNNDFEFKPEEMLGFEQAVTSGNETAVEDTIKQLTDIEAAREKRHAGRAQRQQEMEDAYNRAFFEDLSTTNTSDKMSKMTKPALEAPTHKSDDRRAKLKDEHLQQFNKALASAHVVNNHHSISNTFTAHQDSATTARRAGVGNRVEATNARKTALVGKQQVLEKLDGKDFDAVEAGKTKKGNVAKDSYSDNEDGFEVIEMPKARVTSRNSPTGPGKVQLTSGDIEAEDWELM